MIFSPYEIFLALAICSPLATGQMDIDVAQNRWLSFYENMNGILAKLISPVHTIDFNASKESSSEYNSLLPVLAGVESRKGIDGYEELGNLTIECASDEDCHKYAVTLSCIGADAFRNGQCVNPLKPSEHGCEYDDQCQKTCKESYCSTDNKFRNDKGENQCRCQKGTYFLWKKCWRSCLPGTRPMQHNDEWSCQEQDPHLALAYLRRFKRQASRRLVC